MRDISMVFSAETRTRDGERARHISRDGGSGRFGIGSGAFGHLRMYSCYSTTMEHGYYYCNF